jgi:hypothetical protein
MRSAIPRRLDPMSNLSLTAFAAADDKRDFQHSKPSDFASARMARGLFRFSNTSTSRAMRTSGSRASQPR